MISWAEDAASEFLAEQTAANNRNARFVIEDRLRRHIAPRIWKALRDVLERECFEFNEIVKKKVLLFEIQPQSGCVIRNLVLRKTLNLEYDPEAHRIYFECGNDHGEYLFLVNADSTVELATINHIPRTVEEICRELLNMLRL
jgi:hypothetical protein